MPPVPTTRKPGKTGVLLNAKQIDAALHRLAEAIRDEFPDPANLMVLGIRTRGVHLAERLVALLETAYGTQVTQGILDITLYRDDLSTINHQPMVRDSEIPDDVTDMNIVIVDDVLFTGRTIRAALDETIDYGRPNLIRLAVLIDRGGREYPIQADYVGERVEVAPHEFVQLQLVESDGVDEAIALVRE